jgi:hypothetical protein
VTTAGLVNGVSNTGLKTHVVTQQGKKDDEVQREVLILQNQERMGSPTVPTTTILLKEDLKTFLT